MGKSLTDQDIALLDTYAEAGDRIAYYTQLAAWGYAYGTLALGVVGNDTLGGATANIFFRNSASDQGVTISDDQLATISVDLMQADFRARKKYAIDNPGQELSYDIVQKYHADVFKIFHVSADAWTPNIALDYLPTSAQKQALWTELLTSSAVGSFAAVLQALFQQGDPLEQFANDPVVQSYITNLEIAGASATVSSSNEFGGFTVELANGWTVKGGDQNGNAVNGTSGNDVLIGFDGSDTLLGGTGTDRIYGGVGADVLSGGNDTANPDVNYMDLTYYHSNWNDGARDLLSGGLDDDTILSASDLWVLPEEFYGDTLKAAVNAVDFVDGSDDTFTAFFQIDNKQGLGQLGGTFTLTARDLLGATLVDGLYDLGTVTLDVWQGEAPTDYAVWGQVIDDPTMGKALLIMTSDGYRHQAVLGGVYNIEGILAGLDAASVLHIGTDGNDVQSGGSGYDQYDGGAGDDLFTASAGGDFYDGGDGSDTVDFSATTASLTISLTDDTDLGGDVLISGGTATSDDVGQAYLSSIENVIGGSGDDIIIGDLNANLLKGSGGNDILYGGLGDDTLDGGDGTRDQVNYDGVASNYSFVRNTDGSVTVTSAAYGTDTLLNVELVKFAGDNTVHQLTDLAPLLQSSGPTVITGTAGDDQLYGTGGNDTFDSLGGNDYVNGADGSDTYLYSVNDGDEYIDDESGSMTDVDVLKMKDVNYADVTFSHDSSSSNLVVTVNSTNHVLTLDEQYYSASEGWGLEKIQFADGITVGLQHSDDVWSYEGSDGNDHITGAIWGKQDIFEGGHGNDVISGEAGSDTYIYSKGDGSDLIYDNVGFTVDEGNTDVLRFTDLNQSDLTFSRDGDDLKIGVNDTGDTITVDRQFHSIEQDWGVEQIAFADGTTWDLATIRQSTLLAEATSGRDVIVGFQTDDTIRGGAGNDSLYGMEGNDILSGDLGDDYLEGGIGNDTYKFNFGDGRDTIYDNGNASSDTDVLAFGAGISASDITVTQASNGSDLLLTVGGGGDTILLKNQLTNNAGGVDQITFADNTNWDRAAITSHIAA